MRVRPISVAIIDDSAVVRGLFARWLGEAGDINVVGIHPNGPDALRRIGLVQPDVVLLDLAMPGIDGLQLLPLIGEMLPDSKVLVVSGASQAGADATLRCLMRGAAEYLPKPSAMDPEQGAEAFRAQLLDKIRSLAA